MKKTLTTLSILFVSFFVAFPVFAQGVKNRDRNEERKLERQEVMENLKNQGATIKSQVQNKLKIKARIVKGKVISNNGTSLTVQKDGVSYNIILDDKTKITRKYYGKAVLADILVGHEVNVYGKFSNEAKTEVLASLIRDLSIQKRHAVFVGVVTNITGNIISLKTVNRGTQSVTINESTTKFVNRKMESISYSQVLVGHRIRVKGMWDSAFNTVTEVTLVKDYTLPIQVNKPTGNPNPTVTVAPTAVATPTPLATPTLAPTQTPTPTLTPTSTPVPTPAD